MKEKGLKILSKIKKAKDTQTGEENNKKRAQFNILFLKKGSKIKTTKSVCSFYYSCFF